jgi:hypothetical protein
VNRAFEALLAVWALVDLLQIPLVAAVLAAWRLTPTFGRAWKATAVAFGGYTLWTIATARLVPFAPSGFLLLVLGTFLDPRRGGTPEEAWLVGSGIGVVIFWMVPVFVAWRFRRKRT